MGRRVLLALLSLVAVLTVPPRASATTILGVPLQLELTLNYFPPSPNFGQDPSLSTLTGDFAFDASIGGLPPSPLYPPSPNTPVGDQLSVTTVVFPPQPNIPGTTLLFQFVGDVSYPPSPQAPGPFPVEAFPSSVVAVTALPPSAPWVSLGVWDGSTPFSGGGNLWAFDQPVIVGTFDVQVSAVPEPGTCVLLGTGLVLVGRRLRTRDRRRH
jgi:hypothetical protein